MPDHPATSIEKELLPAMIELASIQRDLIYRIEGIISGSKPPFEKMPDVPGQPRDNEIAALAARGHELLGWLLRRVDQP